MNSEAHDHFFKSSSILSLLLPLTLLLLVLKAPHTKTIVFEKNKVQLDGQTHGLLRRCKRIDTAKPERYIPMTLG